jgi:hypothetical protein
MPRGLGSQLKYTYAGNETRVLGKRETKSSLFQEGCMGGMLIGTSFDWVLRAMPVIVALSALVYLTIINRERPRNH